MRPRYNNRIDEEDAEDYENQSINFIGDTSTKIFNETNDIHKDVSNTPHSRKKRCKFQQFQWNGGVISMKLSNFISISNVTKLQRKLFLILQFWVSSTWSNSQILAATQRTVTNKGYATLPTNVWHEAEVQKETVHTGLVSVVYVSKAW